MRVWFSERHRRHATDPIRFHDEPYAEVPARAERIRTALLAGGFTDWAEPADHGQAPLLAVHTPGLLEFLQTIYPASRGLRPATAFFQADTFATRSARRRSPHPWAQVGYYAFDIEAPFLEGTWEAAYWSAQCALSAADAVLAGECAAYALCRPPGHHALADQIGGFCYLNNAAIAARYLQQGRPTRVAILDVDYHHGNGTQEIFYADPTVFFVSLHAHPDIEYPFFWGGAEERGEGPGAGFNLNLPLPQGTGDAEYLAALDQALAAIRDYAPRYLVVSLGLDIAQGDPASLAGFAVTTAGFRAIGERIAALELPTLIVQEGGYRLDTLGENAVAFLRAFR
ncbi:MAG: histone deacetylase family protein [Anaerolineales bacterium]|nr:histone deacetylase family protein [Anaerolineales bacterium]